MEEAQIETTPEIHINNLLFLSANGRIKAFDVSVNPPLERWAIVLNHYMNNTVTLIPDENEGILYAVSGGVYYKVSMLDGEVIYRWNMANNKAIYSVMTKNQRMVVTNSIKKLYSMRTSSGRTLWKSPEIGLRVDAMCLVHEYVIVVAQGAVHCLYQKDGSLKWRDTSFPEEDKDHGMTLLSHTLPNGCAAVFVGFAGELYLYDIENGEKKTLYKVAERKDFCVSLLVHNDNLFATSEALVVAFNLSNLEKPLWESYIEDTGYHTATTLSVFNNGDQDLLIIGNNGYVVALETESGDTCWTTKIPMSGYAYVSSMCVHGRLFVGTVGKIMELNHLNGEIAWTHRMLSFKLGPIVMATSQRAVNMASDHPIIQSQDRGSGITNLFRSLFV